MLKKIKHSLQFSILPIEIQMQMKQNLCDAITAIPEKNITDSVSEFAVNNRSIGDGLSANFGPFSFYKTPFMREPADNMSDFSPILETYMIKPTQVGFDATLVQNYVGYCIQHGIGPGLFVTGDQKVAEEEMTLRLDDMIDECGLKPKIRENVQKVKGKGTGDKQDRKSYGGTFFRAVGPNSENKAASFPSRWLILNEMDKYPVQLTKNGVNSGDIVKKFLRRQDSFDKLRKTLGGSTPKNKSISRIEPLVEEGDKRYYNIKCPKCKIMHPLTWGQFKWDKKEDGSPDLQFEEIDGTEVITKDPTYHECPSCKYKLRQKEKYDVLQEKGYGGTAEWIPTKKSIRPFVRSYVLNFIYGFRRWEDVMVEFLEVKDDPFKLPDFINDVLGETTLDSQEKPDDHELLKTAQEFEHWPRGFIKKEVIFLTMACDIQKDRIEFALCGWGHNKQAYIIEYWTEPGETHVIEDQCWDILEEKIRAKYIREDGQEMNVQVAFVDSQYNTETVNAFCGDRFDYDEAHLDGVFPIRAQETQDKLVKEFKSDIKTPVVGLHDQKFKHALYTMLRKKPSGPGQFPGHYFHFSHEYGPEFYKQLTSEEILTIKIKGAIKKTQILNTKQRRNETFDICKYQLAIYQYMIDKYFKIVNEERKLNKQNELQESASLFMEHMEQLLYE